MLSQVNSEGSCFKLIKLICDQRSYRRAIPKRLGFTVSDNGRKTLKMTVVFWKLQVEWKYGSIKWLYIKDLKSSYPLELTEYMVVKNINEDPEFNWWVKDALRTCDRILSRMERCVFSSAAMGQGGSKKKYLCATHKFGI